MAISKVDNGVSGPGNPIDCYVSINWSITTSKANGLIYCALYNSITDELLINADLCYVLNAATERNYTIINAQGIMSDISSRGYFGKKGVK